jgi:hypothetical protein
LALERDESSLAATSDTDNRGDDHKDNERECESNKPNRDQDENDDHKSHTGHDDDEDNEDSD